MTDPQKNLASADIAAYLKEIHSLAGTPGAVRIPALVAWLRSAYLIQHPRAPEPQASLISKEALRRRRIQPR